MQKLFGGQAGGVVTFELLGGAAAAEMLFQVRCPALLNLEAPLGKILWLLWQDCVEVLLQGVVELGSILGLDPEQDMLGWCTAVSRESLAMSVCMNSLLHDCMTECMTV